MRKYHLSSWVLLFCDETDTISTAFLPLFSFQLAVSSAREALLASIIRLAPLNHSGFI